MTGFLERLVGDSQACAGELRPLIASRFEPLNVQHTSSAIGEESLREPATFAPVHVQQVVTSESPRANQTVPAAPAAGQINPGIRAGQTDEVAITRSVDRLVADALQPLPIAPAKAGYSYSEPPKNSEVDLLNRISRLGEELRMLQGEARPAGALAPIYVERQNDAEARLEKAAVETPTACATPAAPPQIVPESFPSLSNGSATAPTVNVTIGRIEVRGVKSQEPPPARREPRARIMSLEQYLQRRAAGGGR
jgi:hypothetical protein